MKYTNRCVKWLLRSVRTGHWRPSRRQKSCPQPQITPAYWLALSPGEVLTGLGPLPSGLNDSLGLLCLEAPRGQRDLTFYLAEQEKENIKVIFILLEFDVYSNSSKMSSRSY